MDSSFQYDLILTVVSSGYSEKVVEASRKAGATGGTILRGRDTEVRKYARLFGLNIEPEKEIILTLIEKAKTKAVLEAIVRTGELEKPGKGMALVLNVDRAAGIGNYSDSQKGE